MSKPIKVLLIDDHALFRGGLKALLDRHEDIEVVGEAADALDGAKQATRYAPDVILLDLHMPGMTGLEALGLLRVEVPAARVLMLTVSEDSEDLLATLTAGAAGYLPKNIEGGYLVDSIRRAARGDSVVAPQMTGKLVSGLKAIARGESEGSGGPKERLTPRELQILQCLSRGASNKDIARELDLSESTVKIHVQHILRKLNLASRVQAAVYAVEQGLVRKPL